MENLFSLNGSLYFTILKLTPSINGTKILHFFRISLVNDPIFTSNFIGK